MSPIPGTTNGFKVADHQVVRLLGTGAHTTIWEVRHVATGKLRAVKRVVKESNGDERFFKQVINEYEVASKINHPNIRKVFSLRKIRMMFAVREMHLIMEFCPGQNIQEERPQSVMEICSIFAQVANAMNRINEAGYVHADMKPNNVIVDDHGNVKIIDFGQSCPIGTVKQRVQGTPDFMAPEQVYRWPCDERTDVYNFGASLYWALTGRAMPTVMPKEGINSISQKARAPIEIREDTPPALSQLVMDCVQLQPTDRLASMQEVINRLGVILRKELQPRKE